HTGAERQLLVGIRTVDVEPHRVGEHRFVAVGRGIREQHPSAFGNLHSVHVGVLGRVAQEVTYRRRPANDLFGGAHDAIRITGGSSPPNSGSAAPNTPWVSERISGSSSSGTP